MAVRKDGRPRVAETIPDRGRAGPQQNDDIMAKTISELWTDIPERQQKQIVGEVMMKGGVCYASVYSWIRGKRVPKFLYRKLLKDAIMKYTGLCVTTEELFPGQEKS